jgi:flagellar biosynthesis/type III secretory pathway protein FliH
MERSRALSTPVADFDSPWKEALDEYLEDFLILCFPQAHAEIDWSYPPVFLDGELHEVMRDSALGTRLADKLVRVRLRDGKDAWILIHIEVQSQEEQAFARRMYRYYYRISDHYNQQVVSLAVLADARASWRPDHYQESHWGCSLDFRYPVVKLADWRERQAELAADDNPFATVILAHLAAQATRGDVPGRERAKLRLVRRLYERGYDRERVLSLFRFIDWLLALPEARERALRQVIMTIQEEQHMPYMTSFERISRAEGREEGRKEGREEGREEGKRDALRRLIGVRFGEMPKALEARIDAADQSILDDLLVRVATAQSVAEI